MNKEIDRLERMLNGCLLKLSNPKFVELAPTSILEKDILENLEAERLLSNATYSKVYSHSYVKDGTTYYVYKFQKND